MANQILLSQLTSRIVRAQITENSPIPGTRIIGRDTQDSGGLLSGVLGFVGSFLGKSVKFVGWLIRPILALVPLTFTTLWGVIVQTSSFIYNFDINISDTTIDQQLTATKQILASQLGGTFGNALGYLACGILPSAGILVFNEPLGLYLLKNVGEEALEEFAFNLQALIRISFTLLVKNVFYLSYKNIRKAIKKYAKSNSTNEQAAINLLFGGKLAEAIEVWGEKESKPWSLRLKIEEKIESISNPLIETFVEEFYEETLDACVEAGYVLANGLDTWILQQQQAEQLAGSQNNLIELTPNREATEERLIFAGDNNLIRNQIINAMNNYALIDQRDVGQIIGEPLLDSVRKPPVSLSVRILLRGVKQPPWKETTGKVAKRAQVTIPNFDKTKLDWLTIKNAVGGVNGYLWGRFFVEANLDDGNKITFYAGSESVGKDLAIKFVALTNANLTTLNIKEEQKEGSRVTYPRLYRESEQVYPASLAVINQHKILKLDEGVALTQGVYRRRKYLIPLYTENKPEEFDLIVAQLTSNSITTP